MRNLTCLLPDGFLSITYWAQHPCDGKLYMHEAWVWGPRGRVGYWMPVNDGERYGALYPEDRRMAEP